MLLKRGLIGEGGNIPRPCGLPSTVDRAAEFCTCPLVAHRLGYPAAETSSRFRNRTSVGVDAPLSSHLLCFEEPRRFLRDDVDEESFS